MRKYLVITVAAALALNSCTTNTGTGAYVGAQFGTILGSAIGGLTGGPRGSDVGTLIGMAGGAALGASIGSAADKAETQAVREHYNSLGIDSKQNTYDNNRSSEGSAYRAPSDYSAEGYDSGFDANGAGDDRLYDFQSSDYTGNYSASKPSTQMPLNSRISQMATTDGMTYTPLIAVENARFVDDNQDGVISRGEVCRIVFEVRNNSSQTLYDVCPMVVETSGNKHIYVSPSVHVERLDPHHAIRYTAMVKADTRLKDGSALFSISVIQGGKAISEVNEFTIPTRKTK